jgi:hypothetical protein
LSGDRQPAPAADEATQLRAQLEEERRQRQAAESEAASLRGRVSEYATRLSGEVTGRLSAEDAATDNALAAVETEIRQLKAQKVTLLQEGKFEEAADLDEKMADAVARRQSAQAYKAQLAQRRQEVERQPQTREQQVEAWLNQNGFSPAEKAWVYRNPRFIDDPAFRTQVSNAYNEALREGVQKDSPDLFRRIEERVYARQPAPAADPGRPAAAEGGAAPAAPAADPEPELVIEEPRETRPRSQGGAAMPLDQIPEDARPANPQRRAAGNGDGASAVAAAPPSRRVPGTPSVAGQRTIRLTAEQLDFAKTFASQVAPEIYQKGDVEIARWWATNQTLPSVQAKLEKYGLTREGF